MLRAHFLVKAGELAPKTILCSAVLATVHMWVGKWQKSTVVEKIVKQFSETDVYDALKLLCDVCDRDDPKKRQDSNRRPKGEAFANDIHNTVLELDNSNELPKIVVASFQVKFCPVETVSDSDPGVLVRMERLENAFLEMARKPAAVQTVQQAAPCQPAAAARSAAASVTAVRLVASSVSAAERSGAAGGFGQAMERARSLSRDGRQEQGRAGREQWGSRPDSYAERAAKRRRPGDMDSDGFRVPGRPARKALPKGCSTVHLSGMARAVVAPQER